MDDNIKLFCEAREYLLQSVEEKVEVFMTGMWDPLMKFIIIRETNQIIEKELSFMFPDLPKKYRPKCKFRIFDDIFSIEAGIQNYLNTEPNLTFLGTNDIGATVFDYYIRDTWGASFDHMFIARHGHDENSVFTGSKTAEAEYYMGAMTPLSIAYGMAVEDGFVR